MDGRRELVGGFVPAALASRPPARVSVRRPGRDPVSPHWEDLSQGRSYALTCDRIDGQVDGRGVGSARISYLYAPVYGP